MQTINDLNSSQRPHQGQTFVTDRQLLLSHPYHSSNTNGHEQTRHSYNGSTSHHYHHNPSYVPHQHSLVQDVSYPTSHSNISNEHNNTLNHSTHKEGHFSYYYPQVQNSSGNSASYHHHVVDNRPITKDRIPSPQFKSSTTSSYSNSQQTSTINTSNTINTTNTTNTTTPSQTDQNPASPRTETDPSVSTVKSLTTSPKLSSTPEQTTASNGTNCNRRLAHILSEQKRRENINSGFEDLKNVVPGCRGSADSKAVILRKAVHYIHSLQTELSGLRHAVQACGSPNISVYNVHSNGYPGSHQPTAVPPPTSIPHPSTPCIHHLPSNTKPPGPSPQHHSYSQTYQIYENENLKRPRDDDPYHRPISAPNTDWSSRSSQLKLITYANNNNSSFSNNKLSNGIASSPTTAVPQNPSSPTYPSPHSYYDERHHYSSTPAPSMKLPPISTHISNDNLDNSSHKRDLRIHNER